MKYQLALEYARQMRSNPTPAEKIFWSKVRNRKFHGFKLYRQYIIEYERKLGVSSFYIVDFYCHSNKVIIELDGDIHKYQIQYDKSRENILTQMEYKIIRFSNENIIEDWINVENKLLDVLE